MKTIFLHTILLFLTISSSAQTQLLKNYDFNKGGYCILGTTFWESSKNSLVQSLGEFYTDDIAVLNQFKKEWTFKKPSPQYACGYHYAISVCKNGLVLEQFYINLECNEITSDKGYFYFDTRKLIMFKDKVKPAFSRSIDFTSLSEARAFREKVLLDSSLIMTPTPDWTTYEGTFDFTYKCEQGKKICFEKEDSLITVMKIEIAKTYPGEIFKLTDRGGSWTEIDQTVNCNKTLSDKFNLYYRGNDYFGKWTPYQLNLRTYWTRK